MATEVKTTQSVQAKWYLELCADLESLLEALEVSEEGGEEIKTFMLEVARNQYLAGNRSGIRWAREQSQQGAKTA
jgi:hypothetical protein